MTKDEINASRVQRGLPVLPVLGEIGYKGKGMCGVCAYQQQKIPNTNKWACSYYGGSACMQVCRNCPGTRMLKISERLPTIWPDRNLKTICAITYSLTTRKIWDWLKGWRILKRYYCIYLKEKLITGLVFYLKAFSNYTYTIMFGMFTLISMDYVGQKIRSAFATNPKYFPPTNGE